VLATTDISMRKYKLVIFSKPIKGREQEYNDWYQNVHLHDVVAIEAFKSAQRLGLYQVLSVGTEHLPYMAIYEVETDNIDQAIDELKSRAQKGQMKISDSMSAQHTIGAVYEELGPVVKG